MMSLAESHSNERTNAQCISGPDSVIARDWRFGTNGIDKRERERWAIASWDNADETRQLERRGRRQRRQTNGRGRTDADEPPTRPGRPIRRCRESRDTMGGPTLGPRSIATDRPTTDRDRPTDDRSRAAKVICNEEQESLAFGTTCHSDYHPRCA